MEKLVALLGVYFPDDEQITPTQKMKAADLKKAFGSGYIEGYSESLKDYGNTLLVSLPDAGEGDSKSDFILKGQHERIAAELAIQMGRHPELRDVILAALVIDKRLTTEGITG